MRVFVPSRVLLALILVWSAFGVPSSTAAQDSKTFDASVARPMKAEDLKRHIDAGDKVVIVDAREELDGEIVKGAIQVTDQNLVSWSDSAPKDVPIVMYCTCDDDGLAIGEVVGLQNLGFQNAYYLQGGLEAARKSGIPIVKPAS